MTNPDITVHDVVRVLVAGGYKGGDVDEPSRQNYSRNLIVVCGDGRTLDITLHSKRGQTDLPIIITAETTVDEWDATHPDEIQDRHSR